LGLSLSKRLAELLGGRVDVQSEVGRGSTFSVTIPNQLTVDVHPEIDAHPEVDAHPAAGEAAQERSNER
jgi:chemotaxis protein histidine kinase CheA